MEGIKIGKQGKRPPMQIQREAAVFALCDIGFTLREVPAGLYVYESARGDEAPLDFLKCGQVLQLEDLLAFVQKVSFAQGEARGVFEAREAGEADLLAPFAGLAEDLMKRADTWKKDALTAGGNASGYMGHSKAYREAGAQIKALINKLKR